MPTKFCFVGLKFVGKIIFSSSVEKQRIDIFFLGFSSSFTQGEIIGILDFNILQNIYI